MSEHTKGLLHTGGDGTIIYDHEGWGVANATVFHGRQEPGTSSANARRLALCWNACDGISTEVLETTNKTFAGTWFKAVEIQAQRDNYRAVLEGAEYRDIEGIGRNSVEDSRLIGETAKACTLDIIRARDRAHAQCHELISAFEEVLRISDRDHEAWHRARTAIAAVKGDQPSKDPQAWAKSVWAEHKCTGPTIAQLQAEGHLPTVASISDELGAPRSLEELIKIAEDRGYTITPEFARKVMAAREAKKANKAVKTFTERANDFAGQKATEQTLHQVRDLISHIELGGKAEGRVPNPDELNALAILRAFESQIVRMKGGAQ